MKVPKGAILSEKQPAFSLIEKTVLSLPLRDDGSRDDSSDQKKPFVALKYYLSSFECFSKWTKRELSAFSSFLEKLQDTTWENIHKSTGFRCKCYDVKDMKSGQKEINALKAKLSNDIDFFELRVNDKIRVHGFRMLSAFFLVLLDREHRVFPSD